jgi:glycosyltransferase involved in cell wall biosynthesis
MGTTVAELFPDPQPGNGSREDRAPDPRRLPSLSVVLPAFNEQYNLRSTVEAARKILPMVAVQWEIIVVNDGSGDATGQICDTLASQIPEVRAVHHPDNKGYGAALKSGIVEARHDWIFFSDSDGQFDFAEISRLLEHAATSDIVAGYRKRRNDPPYRALNAAGWKMLVRMTLGVKVRDIDCAFKLFRRSVFEKVQIQSVGAMVNTEIFCQAFKFGMHVREVEVTHYPRIHGAPTGAKLHVILKAMRELIRMRMKMREITHEQEGLYARKSAAELKTDGQTG